MNALPPLDIAAGEAALPQVVAALRAGRLAPFAGAGVAALAAPAVPTSYEALATALGRRVALPKRARGNPWAAAQYIESNRHRATLTALMAEIFAAPVEPTALHRALAALPLPLIVDGWYDGAFRKTLEDRTGWGEIQGITRAGIGEDRWYRAYDAAGAEIPVAEAEAWETLLYKPHGGIVPARNFLVADSDYVEVLTEIDIQTPIPDAVKERRSTLGFLFLGCRFTDQLLRTYARQILKRSAGPHFLVLDGAPLSRNEVRFLAEQAIVPIDCTLADFAAALGA
ncbi:SIR2 family protein [Zavarzinia sp.]|uniref:SIR2 family NAD-dependent protein deacylase n=1 Tax=Zavarzinia sp. TaxID=2027920 RepID=UPI0035690EFC